MTDITITIPSITNIPNYVTDTQEQFTENALLSLQQQQTFSAALNTFATQANTVKTEMIAAADQVELDASESAANALAASASATTATTQADISTTQAGIATTKAGEASTSQTSASASAATSTAQAVIATTKASESSASAVAAAASQVSSSTSASSASLSASRAAASEINAETYSLAARASLDYRGAWSSFTSLASGVAGETYLHDDEIWMLLVNVADIRTVEPSIDLPDTWWAVREQAEFVPSVKPTLDLDFANNSYTIYDSFENSFVKKPLADILTFTRGTVANGVNALGKISEAAIDKPRLVFDGETGEAEGLLVEGSATNLLTRSEDFSVSPWQQLAGLEVTDTGILSVLKDVTWKSVTTNTVHIRQIGNIPNDSSSYTVYCVAKKTSGKIGIRLTLTGGTAVFATVSYNFDTDQVSNEAAGRIKLGDGSVIFYFTLQNNNTGNVAIDTRFYSTDPLNQIEGDSALFAAAQLTATPYPVSYIKTEASQVTRLADGVVRTLGSEFNSGECTVFVEWDNLIDDGKVRSLLKAQRLNDVSSSWSGFGIESNSIGGVRAIIRDSSSGYDAKTVITEPITRSGKAALSLKNGMFIAAINGKSSVLTGSELPSTFKDMIYLFVGCGARLSGGVGVESYRSEATILNVKIYPRALSPTDCIKLTKL